MEVLPFLRLAKHILKDYLRTSLVVQQIRIPCQCRGHGFNPVWEDPTCHRTTKPAREAITLKSRHTTIKSRPHSPQLGKAHVQQQRASTDKDYIGLYLKQPSYRAVEYQKLDRNSCSSLMRQATHHRVQAENN